LTIFEMLEKLETEIVSLQTRYRDLANALQHPAANGNGIVVEKQQRARKPVKKKKPLKSASKKNIARVRGASAGAHDFAQLELPVSESGTEDTQQGGRVLGKRQALGKSLVQLRKMSAWRNARATEE
jgi:hypothetical protein